MQVSDVSYNTFLRVLLVPDHNYRDKTNRLLCNGAISPQENIAPQLFLSGISASIWADSRSGNPCYTVTSCGTGSIEMNYFLSLEI